MMPTLVMAPDAAQIFALGAAPWMPASAADRRLMRAGSIERAVGIARGSSTHDANAAARRTVIVAFLFMGVPRSASLIATLRCEGPRAWRSTGSRLRAACERLPR